MVKNKFKNQAFYKTTFAIALVALVLFSSCSLRKVIQHAFALEITQQLNLLKATSLQTKTCQLEEVFTTAPGINDGKEVASINPSSSNAYIKSKDLQLIELSQVIQHQSLYSFYRTHQVPKYILYQQWKVHI